MTSLLARYRRMRLRYKIPLTFLALVVVGLLALFAALWAGYRRYQDLPLERWIPEGATCAARVQDLPALIETWDQSSVRGIAAREKAGIEAALREAEIELPPVFTGDFHVDVARAIPANAPSALTPERVMDALRRDLLLIGGADGKQRAVGVAVRVPFTTYAAARVGLWLNDAFGGGVEAVQGEPLALHSLALGDDQEIFLAVMGDVLLVGTSAGFVESIAARALAGGGTPTALARLVETVEPEAIGLALDGEAMRARDPALHAVFRDALRSIPVQEAAWTFDFDACRTLGGTLFFAPDGVSLAGPGTLDPARIPARLTDAFRSRAGPWTVADALPDSTVFAALARNSGRGMYDSCRALVRDGSRPGVNPAVADVVLALYQEVGRMLEVAEKRGLEREIVPLLGGEAAWTVFAEDVAGGKAPGLAVVVQSADGDALLRILDRWSAELGEAAEDAIAVEHVRVEGADVRVLTSKLNRWSDLLSPCYAVIDGRLVASTATAYVRRMLAAGGDRRPRTPPRWRAHAEEVITLSASGAVALDFLRSAELIEGAADGLAELLSDRLDRREIRAGLRPQVQRSSGLRGEALEQQLDGEVARAVDLEKGRIRREILDAAKFARQLTSLAAEWTVAGNKLEYRIVLLTP